MVRKLAKARVKDSEEWVNGLPELNEVSGDVPGLDELFSDVPSLNDVFSEAELKRLVEVSSGLPSLDEMFSDEAKLKHLVLDVGNISCSETVRTGKD